MSGQQALIINSKHLPTGWKTAMFRECCTEISDGDWIETKDQGGSDYRLLQVSNIGVGAFVETGNFRYVTQETFDRLRCKEVLPEHILVSRMPEPVGRAWYVKPMPWRAITAVDVAIIDTDHDILDPVFCTYYLNSPFNLDYARAHASGTTRLRITRRDLETFPIPVPPLPTQRRIASILSAYDDLIENNTRRIKILEQMAQAIYREWFVEFRFPGHECVKINEGIPEGWEKSELSNVCEYVIDGDWIETKDQGGSDYRLLQVSNVGVGEFVETGNYRYISQETFERLKCHEVLPGHILISRMPEPIGRAWLVTEMPWRMITAVDVAIIKTDPSRMTSAYCLYLLNSPEMLAMAQKQATGTTRARITRRNLCSTNILVPPIEIQRKFSDLALTNYNLGSTLRRQNANLRQTRDLLLPRLVGGEIEVRSSE